MSLSTWKLLCRCPKCGKEYLFSEIEASMFLRSNLGLPYRWRFHSLPGNLRCEQCGEIDPNEVTCQFPIRAIPTGSNRFVWAITLVTIGLIIVVVVIMKLVAAH